MQDRRYMLQILLPMCNPLDRIKRAKWLDKTFLIMPNSKFENFYLHNYISSIPAVHIYSFTTDDLQADDWIRL